MVKPRNFLLNHIRRSHSKRWARFAAAGCEKFLRAFHNEEHWSMEQNGETEIIRRLLPHLTTKSPIALDVGAHEGEWADQLLRVAPNSFVTCFEVLPSIRDRLRNRFSEDRRVTVAQCGLSSSAAVLEVTWNRSFDTTNAIAPALEGRFYKGSDLCLVPCEVKTGDEYLRSAAIERVDFLKIDTEGHEVSVLKGFCQLLASPYGPRVIQFEYGSTWLAGRHTLADVYKMLAPMYSIGRLYPDGVDFKPYELSDENFRMGNYIAAKAEPTLLKALQLY
jgi:FkbM family methyltransferase